MIGAVLRTQNMVPQWRRDTEIEFRVVMVNLVVSQEFFTNDVLEPVAMQDVMG